MNSYSMTIFTPKETLSKKPYSPFDDNTFIFNTVQLNSNMEMFNVLVKYFILNLPINLKEPTRTFRRKANLDPYYNNTFDYFILDIDDVKTLEDRNKILEYFKKYKVILGASKSYNDLNNFNMKGILFCEPIEYDYLKQAISVISHDLIEYCKIDEAVIRKATLNAPLNKHNVFINNESNYELYKFEKVEASVHINEIKNEYYGNSISININEINKLCSEETSIDKICLNVFKNMGFEAIKNNDNDSITFKHPSEKKSVGGYFWFSTSPYTMHHANSTKTINIFDTVRTLDVVKELMKKEINYNDELLQFNTDNDVLNVNEKYLSVNEKIKLKVNTFINNKNGLLSIKSPMGTGKSTIIKHIIEECLDVDMKVLIITNRISVAQDFAKKYDMKLYNSDMYNVGDSLVVQYDSLWKYNIKYFDIVIMDEFISLMLHSRNNLNNNSLNIAKFFGCFNKKLVIADAFLTGYENFLLNDKKVNVHLINNLYRDPIDLYSYDDYNYFVNSLVYHSKKHKITVSSTSLSFINSLKLLLEKTGLKVVALTAETQESTKELIYNLFEKEDNDKWDVLIYSPTLTVGVSNLNNVRYHFHYDSSISTDCISSMQMIKRTRKAKEIHLFIKERVNYLKTSYNDIRDEYMCNIGKYIEHNYLFTVDNYGEAKLSDIGKKAIKIDTFKNILEFNHKAAMEWLFSYHFLHEPKIINKTGPHNILMKYQKQIKNDKEILINNNINQYLMLNDIEKTDLLLGKDSDKFLKAIALIDSKLENVQSEIKKEILELTISDPSFIEKCKYYKITKNYLTKEYNDNDIKNLISTSIINNNNEDLYFYNILLTIKHEFLDYYNLGSINKDKKFKYIIDKCGYKYITASGSIIGSRYYQFDKNVKKYFQYIR